MDISIKHIKMNVHLVVEKNGIYFTLPTLPSSALLRKSPNWGMGPNIYAATTPTFFEEFFKFFQAVRNQLGRNIDIAASLGARKSHLLRSVAKKYRRNNREWWGYYSQ